MTISSKPDFAEINVELGKSSSSTMTLNDGDVRYLAGKTSGTIALGDFIGKSATSSKTITHSYTGTGKNTNSYSGTQSTPYARTLDITGGSFQIQSDQISYSSNSTSAFVQIQVNGVSKWSYTRSTSSDTTVSFPSLSIPLSGDYDSTGVQVRVRFYSGTYNYLINQTISQDNYKLRNCTLNYTVNG